MAPLNKLQVSKFKTGALRLHELDRSGRGFYDSWRDGSPRPLHQNIKKLSARLRAKWAVASTENAPPQDRHTDK